MARFQDIINYFNQKAVQFLGQTETEKHFYRSHEEMKNFPAMGMEAYRGSLVDNQGDGFFAHRDIQFSVMDHLHNTDDDTLIDAIYDNMEALGLQIAHQMYFDGVDRLCAVNIDFDLNGVTWRQLENIEDHNYGWLFTIPIRNITNYVACIKGVSKNCVDLNDFRGPAGKNIELQESATHIQWRVVGDINWINLVALADLTGPQGEPGNDGAQGPSGQNGANGKNIELQESATHIQWRLVGDINWINLVALADLTGPQGEPGNDGAQGPSGQNGANGKNIELQESATHIQWRLVGEINWINLVALADLTGPEGPQGETGSDGLSAYQIAVLHGFVGTEQQWLDSIASTLGAIFTGEVKFNKTVEQPCYANTFSASKTINFSYGNIQSIPVTGTLGISLQNLREGVNILIMTNDSNAGWAVTVDATFGTKTDNSATHSTAANKVNIYTIIKYGSIVKYTIETSS
jgi:hypothetical protein